MWCGLLLGGFLATGAQAFRPGPIRWGGRLGKKLFLTPTVPLDGSAAPQRLTLGESSDGKVPYFTANQDHTISCDDNDLRWCLEAGGAERGHVVRVNHCTTRPAQKWRWLPWGPIQLEGTNQCIVVDENDGLTTGSVQLGECVHEATDTWMFEDTAPALAWSSSHKFPFANFSIGAAVMVLTLGLGAWMWRWQKESRMFFESRRSVPLTMGQSGVCLTKSIAVRSNEIAMKLQKDEGEQSNDAVPSPFVSISGYTRGKDDGSPVDEAAIDKLLADQDLATQEMRILDAITIRLELDAMGVSISELDRKWTVGKSSGGREPKAGRGSDDGSVVGEMAVKKLPAEMEQVEEQPREQVEDMLREFGVFPERKQDAALLRKFGVADVLSKAGPTDAKPFGRTYKRVGPAPGVDEQRVMEMITERMTARNGRNHSRADQILSELLDYHGVVVVDSEYTWRFVGDSHDGAYAEGDAYERRVFESSTPTDGHDYERHVDDRSPLEAWDLQVIDELLALRLSKKKNRKFAYAHVLREELYARFGVTVDDRGRTWCCKTSNPLTTEA